MRIVTSFTIDKQLVKLYKTIGNVEIYRVVDSASTIYFVQDGKVINKLTANDCRLLFTKS